MGQSKACGNDEKYSDYNLHSSALLINKSLIARRYVEHQDLFMSGLYRIHVGFLHFGVD